jgi:transposase
VSDTASTHDATTALARVAELEAQLAAERAERAEVEAERDRLREAYQALVQQVELMRRRLYVAKAERIDTAQLELEFADKLAALDALSAQLAAQEQAVPASEAAGAPGRPPRKPRGRRPLSDLDVPEERIELIDVALEGQVPRLGSEEVSSRMMWRRGGWVRVVVERVKYRKVSDASGTTSPTDATDGDATPMVQIITAPLPPEMIERSIGTPSLWAHIAAEKFCDGLPLNRQEDRFARIGVSLDRGTMSRWLQDIGLTCGATVVEAMRREALRTAFCIATDATGVLVQPLRDGTKKRQPCRRGHYFVQIADADHVFFEYTPRETSAAVGQMFRGFSGFVQADAKSVYDFLFRPPGDRAPPDDVEPDGAVRHEVGCWSHARTKLWEAAIATQDVVAREALARIMRMFQLEGTWRGRPPAEIKSLRDIHLRPHVDAFFAFVAVEYERVRGQRGLLRSALGYAHRQEDALRRFLEDGRLAMTNNHSERQLRRIATGRKAWLFVGSDDHGQAAGNLFTLIASARLHGLDPEAYLRDLFRVLPQWPRDRYLELAPKYWRATRVRLDPAQLDVELGWLTIPPPPSE